MSQDHIDWSVGTGRQLSNTPAEVICEVFAKYYTGIRKPLEFHFPSRVEFHDGNTIRWAYFDEGNNFQNDKTSKQMEQPNKEQVLKAAASCSTAKTVLKILYPEAFADTERDHEPFCTVGQVLKRKGYNHEYAVIMKQRGLFQIYNISQWSSWNTTGRTAQELGIKENGVITRGMFKKLLDQTSFPIDEFSAQ